MPRFLDLFDRLARALSPSARDKHLPTMEDFEPLLMRLEREFTIAYASCVWKSTWAEVLALSRRLFADKGDLCEFYALDHAADLVLSRGIEGIDETFRDCLDGPDRSGRSGRLCTTTSVCRASATG